MTGNDIYNTAMDLCALRTTSNTIPTDCADFTQRATGLLNLLLAENAYLDSLIKNEPIIIPAISALTDTVNMSAVICAILLPYGLACLLIQNEDANAAAFFKMKYETEKAKIQSNIKGRLASITEVY